MDDVVVRRGPCLVGGGWARHSGLLGRIGLDRMRVAAARHVERVPLWWDCGQAAGQAAVRQDQGLRPRMAYSRFATVICSSRLARSARGA